MGGRPVRVWARPALAARLLGRAALPPLPLRRARLHDLRSLLGRQAVPVGARRHAGAVAALLRCHLLGSTLSADLPGLPRIHRPDSSTNRRAAMAFPLD